MILSNIVENGKPIGLADAGQDWHTDMSYSRTIAFANVLYGIKIPQRDGKPLGATEFCNMHAAYDGLPADLKRRLDGMTVLHDFNKFWEMMRREKGSKRPPLTEAQRKAKPPVSQPIFLTHPLTGRKVLYANPGYAVRINELPEKESDEMLEFLFAHQLKPEYRYTFRWQEGDVLMWEDIGTIHNAVADYGPDEHRLIKRCQVMADRFCPRKRHEAPEHPEDSDDDIAAHARRRARRGALACAGAAAQHYPDEADADRRRLRRRRPDRRDRARHRAGHDRRARPVRHRREPHRRERDHRHRARGARGAGRLHDCCSPRSRCS